MAQSHEYYMRLAIDEAEKGGREGNQAVGTVIVRDGSIAAAGRNLVSSNNDPTAHAETVALRMAGAELGQADLGGCVLYTTFQPCPMCCGAIMVSGIDRVVVGARPDPAVRQFGPYIMEAFVEWTGWSDRIEVLGGVLSQECFQVWQKWRDEHGTPR